MNTGIKDEFKVHHHVSELMATLGVTGKSSVGAEFYTDILLKNMTPYVTTQTSSHQAKRKIAETTNQPIEFLSKYDELKAKNVRNVDQLVYFLSKLSTDTQTKSFLESHKKEQEAKKKTLPLSQHQEIISELPPSNTNLTQQDLAELQTRLRLASDIHATSDSHSTPLWDNTPKRTVNLPPQPDWLRSRPALTIDFMAKTNGQLTNAANVDTLPLQGQEQEITKDIIRCMQGLDGTYIVSKPITDQYTQREFLVDPTLDTSYKELANRILPLCSNFSTIVRFIEDPSYKELANRILPLCSNFSTIVRFIEEKSRFEYGLVMHALSAAIRSLIKDYRVLVCQLERQLNLGKLSLQKLWFYLQPTMRTFAILASVVNAINRASCTGGAVLSLLHEKTNNIGDEKGHELCLYLTQAACVPYFEILEKWIYKGIVRDPYAEFMIEENEDIQKEALETVFTDEYPFYISTIVCTL